MSNESAAKRCWMTAVDHHKFFRCVDSNDSKHKSRFGARQPTENRTLFQAALSSQMFDVVSVRLDERRELRWRVLASVCVRANMH